MYFINIFIFHIFQTMSIVVSKHKSIVKQEDDVFILI